MKRPFWFDLTSAEKVQLLDKIADDDSCQCDAGPPWGICDSCLAAGALNDANELFNAALKELEVRGGAAGE